MQPTVAEKVRATAERFAGMGASLEEISIPEHTLVAAVWNPIALEGLLVQMMHGNGMGFNWKGQYDVGLLDAHEKWRGQAEALSKTLKICMLVGQWASASIRAAITPRRATSPWPSRPPMTPPSGATTCC